MAQADLVPPLELQSAQNPVSMATLPLAAVPEMAVLEEAWMSHPYVFRESTPKGVFRRVSSSSRLVAAAAMEATVQA